MDADVLWMMTDSEFCGNCGAALNPYESDLCWDCIQDADHDERQDAYDDWYWYDDEEAV